MGARFFLPLVIRLAVVAAGPLAVGWWLAGPIGGGAAAVVLLGLELWRIDRTVRTAADDRVSYTPTPPGDLTWLDEDAIRQALRDLRTLGFQPVADCTYHLPVVPAGFTRVLAHRGERAYACVAQGRRGTHAPEAVAVTLFSRLEDGRTLTTTSAEPSSTMAFGLERIDSWQIRPGAAVHDLTVEHLATRATLCTARTTTVAGDGTLGDFVTSQSALFHRQAQECRMNGALGVIGRGLTWERHRHKSWVDGVFSKETPLIARPLQPSSGPTAPIPAGPSTPPAPAAAPTAAAAKAPRPPVTRTPAPTEAPARPTPAATPRKRPASPPTTPTVARPATARASAATPTPPSDTPDSRRGRRRSPPSPTYGTAGPSDARPAPASAQPRTSSAQPAEAPAPRQPTPAPHLAEKTPPGVRPAVPASGRPRPQVQALRRTADTESAPAPTPVAERRPAPVPTSPAAPAR